MLKKPTIRDVAKATGVSIATVSFVLNDRPGQVISDRVKQKVLRAAKRLNYHPSAAAAGLARQKTKNIAIVFYRDEHLVSNQFYSFVIEGAIKEANKQHYNLLFSFMPDAYKGYADLPKVIRENNAEGALFISQVDRKLIRDIQVRAIPVVAIDHFPPVPKLDSLQIDNRHGGELAAEHLLDLGHRKVGILVAAADRPSVADRVAGFRGALSDRNVSFSPRRQILKCAALKFEAGYNKVKVALSRRHDLTALFCVNDELAAGALRAAHECGLRVPEDLSVVGFDDITMSNYTDPPLTTVGVDKDDLGARAIARLIECVESPNHEPRCEVVPVELCVRRSTAAPGG